MSTKHTPGPWKHVAVSGGWDGVADSHGNEICRLVLNEPANATLIAAAPELLQALDHAARSLLSMNLWLKDHPNCDVSDGARDILIRHQREAERAVAQAKGGTP